MSTQPVVEQPGPAVAGEVAGKELALTAPLLTLGIDVIHEFIDEGDGDLLDLALGIGHFAHQDVAGSVDAAFGVGVQHNALFSSSTKQESDRVTSIAAQSAI